MNQRSLYPLCSLALALAAPFLAGCVSPQGGMMSSNFGQAAAPAEASDLKFCGIVQGSSWNRPLSSAEGRQLVSELRLDASPASSMDEASTQGCDVFVSMTSPSRFGDSNLVMAEAFSPRTRRTLATTRGISGAMGGFGGSIQASLAEVGRSLTQEFARGSELHRRVVEERDNAPAAAPGAGISRKEFKELVDQAVANRQPQQPPETAEAKSDVDQPGYKRPASPDDFALIVGVEKYAGLPDAQFAERDARATREHLVALGYPERNVVLLTGAQASRAGLAKNLETRLPQLVKPGSTVFFYFSGHGAPDAKTGHAYLVPVDGDPEYLDDTAYPLSRLYGKLAALKAKRVIVALDSCFSGAGGRSIIAKGTRPLVTKVDIAPQPGKLVVLAASAGQQISGTLAEQGHGAFTYFLLRGLNGAARDDSGVVTIRSLFDYLSPNVQDAARRSNRDQNPQLLADDAAAGLRLR